MWDPVGVSHTYGDGEESEENDLEDDWEGHEGREVEVGDEGLDSELETVALFEY